VVIMTMHNISLTPRAGKPGLLVLQGTIRTYRYLDEDEVANQNNGGKTPATAGGSK
jgi:type IV pilus assembly protein PilO